MFAAVIVCHYLCRQIALDCQEIKELLTYLLTHLAVCSGYRNGRPWRLIDVSHSTCPMVWQLSPTELAIPAQCSGYRILPAQNYCSVLITWPMWTRTSALCLNTASPRPNMALHKARENIWSDNHLGLYWRLHPVYCILCMLWYYLQPAKINEMCRFLWTLNFWNSSLCGVTCDFCTNAVLVSHDEFTV